MTGANRTHRNSMLPVLLAGPLLFVLRLHLLVRTEMALDGDEAVVGLMSLHLVQGKGWPLFFYGQSYGLSGLEVLSGALWFTLLDVSAGALRVAALMLWALGGAFLVAAAGRLGNRACAWWALALMAAYTQVTGITNMQLTDANVLIGLLLGAMLPFLFAGLTMAAVGGLYMLR